MEKIIKAFLNDRRITCTYIDYNDLGHDIEVLRINLNNHGIFELYHKNPNLINPIPLIKFYRVKNVVIKNECVDYKIPFVIA